jgi:hypothetical protein
MLSEAHACAFLRQRLLESGCRIGAGRTEHELAVTGQPWPANNCRVPARYSVAKTPAPPPPA